MENWRSISHLSGWNKSLEDHCAFLHGYKLSWRKDADPYKVKILQSSIRSRKNSAGVRSQESGVRSQESGVRSQESGVRSQESGVRSQESGVRSQESGVRSQNNF
ncbi:hypothetical protein [Trichormus azollae]|uniref:hypothetical protein n=1 Tax=Trichormus azollae TaxID=1164 RepID=UPI00308415F1